MERGREREWEGWVMRNWGEKGKVEKVMATEGTERDVML